MLLAPEEFWLSELESYVRIALVPFGLHHSLSESSEKEEFVVLVKPGIYVIRNILAH